MKLKIKKYDLIWFLILIPFFRPDSLIYPLNKLWGVFQDFSLIIGIVFLIFSLIKKEKPGIITAIIVAYYIGLLLSTLYNGINIGIDLRNIVKFAIFIACSEVLLRINPMRFCKLCSFWIFSIILINFISIVIFPNGIIKDSYNTPINFWATDNHLISIILCGITYCYALYTYDSKQLLKNKRRFSNIMFISILTILIVWSGTALVVLGIFIILYYIGKNFDQKGKILNAKNLIIIGVIIQLSIVIFRVQYMFEWFITGILQKDITFTNRTILWNNALEIIKNNLVFGLGNPIPIGLPGWLSMSYWNEYEMKMVDVYFIAHNQFLEILVNGGIVSVIPFLLAILYAVKKIQKYKDKPLSKVLGIIIFAYTIVMLTETVYPYPPFYLVLILAANIGLIIENKILIKSKEC